MRTLLAVIVLAAPAASPRAAEAVRSDAQAIELLPARGEIRTAEGFIRAEGADPGGAPGSFGTFHPAGPAWRGAAGGYVAPELAPPPAEARRQTADPCRPERDRYLRRLLEMAGVYLERPSDLLQALAGPAGFTGEYLFTAYGLLAGVEPIRPLAWDTDLRRAADELAECGDRSPPVR